MRCTVLRASRRDEMYLYVRQLPDGEADLAVLPPDIAQALGKLTPVMALDLDGRQSLARVPLAQVREALAGVGFFVQMPPDGLINPTAPEPEGLRGA